MTRDEWLSQLKAGDAVLLRTQLRTYRGVADRRDGERLWVIFELRNESESATWVDPVTGANPHTMSAIFQLDSHTSIEGLQGDEIPYPPPYHSEAIKIDSRPVFGGLNGIDDGGAS